MLNLLYKLAEFRLKNYEILQYQFMITNGLLIFINFLWLIGGVSFTGLNLWDNSSGRLNAALSAVMAMVIIFFVIITFVGVCGIIIGKMNHPQNWMVGFYGLCILLLVCIPMFAEGAAFRES